MKQIKLVFLAVMMLLTCSCARGGIGDKLIVKAIFLDKVPEFKVQLMVIKAAPSADAGSAAESTVLLTGQGATLFDAFQQAEASYSGDVFYGQNELLLIGPALKNADLFESCRYLSDNSTGRPNMAVYGIDLPADKIEDLAENGTSFLNHMDQISQQNQYKTFLYQMIHSDETGILPTLRCSEEGDVQIGPLNIYCQGREYTQWDGAQQTLACLLSGQGGAVHNLALYDNGNKIILDMRTPQIFYECIQDNNQLTLIIRITGHIQNILGMNGLYSQDQKQQSIQILNDQIQSTVQAMLEQAFNPQMDLFSLLSRFYNQNQSITQQMQQEESIYQTQRIQIVSQLKVI